FRAQIKPEACQLLRKLLVTYLVLYCACTVKLALCVSLLSDITPQISDLKFQISNTVRSMKNNSSSLGLCVTSDNSHYSIFKELLLLHSTSRRNFNVQPGRKGRG